MSSGQKKDKRLSISRRSFLKASGVTGLTIFAASLTKPAETLFELPESPSEPNTEGVISEKWLNTSCLNCPARCATSVRVVNGKAVRIAGNRLSQVSEGEICPRGHIGLQVLYDTARITSPMKRTNPAKGRDVDPRWEPVLWDEALNILSGRLQELRNSGTPEQMAIFSGLNARSDEDLISRFATAYGTPNLITGDALENEAERVGRWMADGNYSHIAYELGETNYVLSFGASIIESERPLARNLRMWGKIRRERPIRARVVVIDPRYSVTAAKADLWLPIKPGTDGALALAIANVIIEEGLYDKEFIEKYTTGFGEYRAEVSAFTLETVATITGIEADTIRKIAREFAETKPAIAWVGRGAAGWPNGTVASYYIFCLNALVGSINVPGGILYQEEPNYHPMPDAAGDSIAKNGLEKTHLDGRKSEFFPEQVAANIAAKNITDSQPYPLKLAIGFNSNFNMTAPSSSIWDGALQKIPYYVHVAPFISEMALYADLLLPAATFLEQWGYDHSPPGSGFAEVRIKQPVVDIESEAKSVGDTVFDIARKCDGSVAAAFDGIGDDAEGFARFRTGDMISWSEFKDKGVWVGSAYRYGKYDRIFKTHSKKFDFAYRSLNAGSTQPSATIIPGLKEAYLGNELEFPFILTTYQPLMTMENGSQDYPWAQEIALVMHGVGWTSLAEMNTETAHSLRVKDGDAVWVESPYGRLKFKARVTEWVHPEIIAIARGQGHYAPGKWQKGIGANPNDITGLGNDVFSGQAALYNTRVKVYRA
jgi:anaerobic selenocysteine-containing dehydrogenase